MRRRPAACTAAWAAGRARQLCPDAAVVPVPVRRLRRGEQGRLRDLQGHRPGRGGDLDRRGLPRRARDGALRRHAEGDRARGCARACARRWAADQRRRRARPSSSRRWPARSLSRTGCSSCRPDSELDFLHPLPVERLWGVGPITSERLHDAGLHTVGEVAALPSARSWSCSGALRAASCTRSRTTATRGGCRCGAGGAGRSARSTRSAGAHARRRRWMPRSWRWWTAPAGGCGQRAGCAGRSCCGCASPTSSARPARTRSARPPTAPRWCWRPHERCSTAAQPLIERARDHARGRGAVEPRGRRTRPARRWTTAPLRSTRRSTAARPLRH